MNRFDMALIKSKNTKPEILVRKFFHANGLRFRLHSAKLPGKPDIILPKYKTIVFVHGCFWHLHENCRFGKLPKKNLNYWKKKLEGNIRRDKNNIALLKKTGWKVIVLWECHINSKNSNNYLSRQLKKIKNQKLNA